MKERKRGPFMKHRVYISATCIGLALGLPVFVSDGNQASVCEGIRIIGLPTLF